MLIVKNDLVPAREHNIGKKVCKTGSTIWNEKRQEHTEIEFSHLGLPNAGSAIQRHYSAKQTFNRKDIRRFRKFMDKFFKYLKHELDTDPVEIDYHLLDYTRDKTNWSHAKRQSYDENIARFLLCSSEKDAIGAFKLMVK